MTKGHVRVTVSEVKGPKRGMYEKHRFLVSFTREALDIVDANVGAKGSGKPFTRKSDFIDYCINQYSKEETPNLLLKQLRDQSVRLMNLREDHYNDGKRGSILSQFYSIPLDRPVQLAARARADFEKHQTLCPNCDLRQECSYREEECACWRVKNEGAVFADPEEIFPTVYAALEIREVERRIKDLEVRVANRQIDMGREKSSRTVRS